MGESTPDSFDFGIGISLEASGNRLAILTYKNCYIYDFIEGQWTQVGTTLGPPVAANFRAVDVSADGTTVAVGEHGANIAGTDSGSVTVFRKEGDDPNNRRPTLPPIPTVPTTDTPTTAAPTTAEPKTAAPTPAESEPPWPECSNPNEHETVFCVMLVAFKTRMEMTSPNINSNNNHNWNLQTDSNKPPLTFLYTGSQPEEGRLFYRMRILAPGKELDF